MTTLKTAVYQTISSLALDVLLSKLASLILFQGALFSGVDGFSSKLEKKKPWKVLFSCTGLSCWKAV